MLQAVLKLVLRCRIQPLTWTCVSPTFTHADGAALPVLPVAVAAVLVAGERRALDTATHLAAVLVPPAEGNKQYSPSHTHIMEN